LLDKNFLFALKILESGNQVMQREKLEKATELTSPVVRSAYPVNISNNSVCLPRE